jgi:hypothetical protein
MVWKLLKFELLFDIENSIKIKNQNFKAIVFHKNIYIL